MLDILLGILTVLGAIVLAGVIIIVVFGFRVMRDAETKGDRS